MLFSFFLFLFTCCVDGVCVESSVNCDFGWTERFVIGEWVECRAVAAGEDGLDNTVVEMILNWNQFSKPFNRKFDEIPCGVGFRVGLWYDVDLVDDGVGDLLLWFRVLL